MTDPRTAEEVLAEALTKADNIEPKGYVYSPATASRILAALPEGWSLTHTGTEAQGPRHGRHCPCSACAREDWTNPDLAPCDYHGVRCAYSPLAASPDSAAQVADYRYKPLPRLIPEIRDVVDGMSRHLPDVLRAYRQQRVENIELREAIMPFAKRQIDGLPCFCVSDDDPHAGWVHGSACGRLRGLLAGSATEPTYTEIERLDNENPDPKGKP